MVPRKIIHIDMDSFYASVEMRDDPSLRGQPIAVGGRPDRRGVICTCNYIARNYGIRSAMSTAYALRLCPTLVILPVNMSKYKAVAEEIRQVFYGYTRLVEPLSLDEAFLDVTATNYLQGSASRMAEAIRREIYDRFQLTASAGAAPNKFLAKIASEWHKPNGLCVISPEMIDTFVAALSVNRIPGVGKVTAQRLLTLQIKNCADLQKIPLAILMKEFGKWGKRLHELSFGIDESPVEPERIQKSVSVEETFTSDIADITKAFYEIELLFKRLQQRLQKHSNKPLIKQFVKVKFHDFSQTTVECSVKQLSANVFKQLFQAGHERKGKPVRLLGIGVHFGLSQKDDARQLKLLLHD